MYRPSAALVAVLLTFAIASTASADSFCVAPATGCDHTATSLQSALSSAGSLPGDDTISLGAATYTEDNLVYSPGDHARVSITGAGSTSTAIQPATASAGGVTLRASLGPMDVNGARIVAGDAAGTWALWLNAGGNLDHVDIGAAGATTSASGVLAATPATFSAIHVAIPGSGRCVAGNGSGTLTLRDSTLTDCNDAIAANADTVAQRLRLLNVVNGIDLVGDSLDASLDDSLFIGRNTGTGAKVEQSITSGGLTKLRLNQDTFIGSGVGTGASASNTVNDTYKAQLYVYDSIIRNFTTPVACTSNGGDPADVDGDYVNYTGTTSDGCTGDVSLGTTSTSDPQFVNQGDGDYHLKATSPLVDQDLFQIDTISGESPTDLDGSVRIINGARDLGAFERPLAPAAAAGAATDVTQTSAGVPASANGGGAHASVKLVYGPTASYGSEMVLEPTAADFADHAYSVALTGLSPSTTYHYALVVTNSTGTATSADQAFTTGSPPPPVCCAPPPPVAKAALSALKITPSKFRAASKGATFAKAVGAKVTYTLSAAGTVKFRVLRAVKGVKAGGRCVAKSRRHRTGKACTRYVAVGKSISRVSTAGANSVRFSGRVAGKKLRPGRYRLQSVDPAGATKRASFTIIRR